MKRLGSRNGIRRCGLLRQRQTRTDTACSRRTDLRMGQGSDDIDAVHPISLNADGALPYAAALDITAPGKIASLTVEITSATLNELGITSLDMINDTAHRHGKDFGLVRRS